MGEGERRGKLSVLQGGKVGESMPPGVVEDEAPTESPSSSSLRVVEGGREGEKRLRDAAQDAMAYAHRVCQRIGTISISSFGSGDAKARARKKEYYSEQAEKIIGEITQLSMELHVILENVVYVTPATRELDSNTLTYFADLVYARIMQGAGGKWPELHEKIELFQDLEKQFNKSLKD